jgi:hypothetical protein
MAMMTALTAEKPVDIGSQVQPHFHHPGFLLDHHEDK